MLGRAERPHRSAGLKRPRSGERAHEPRCRAAAHIATLRLRLSIPVGIGELPSRGKLPFQGRASKINMTGVGKHRETLPVFSASSIIQLFFPISLTNFGRNNRTRLLYSSPASHVRDGLNFP